MNPLANNNAMGMPFQFHQNIQQVKALMQMAKGNPMVLAQQNPMVAQVMQMCQGQNPEKLFYEICKQRGIDPQSVLKEFNM